MVTVFQFYFLKHRGDAIGFFFFFATEFIIFIVRVQISRRQSIASKLRSESPLLWTQLISFYFQMLNKTLKLYIRLSELLKLKHEKHNLVLRCVFLFLRVFMKKKTLSPRNIEIVKIPIANRQTRFKKINKWRKTRWESDIEVVFMCWKYFLCTLKTAQPIDSRNISVTLTPEESNSNQLVHPTASR